MLFRSQPTTTTTAAAAEEGEKEKSAETRGSADNNGFVTLNPSFNTAEGGGAVTFSVVASAIAIAGSAVEEVLWHDGANLLEETFGEARQGAAGFIARPGGIVAIEKDAALLIARGALARGALKAVAAGHSIVGDCVLRTGCVPAGAGFLGIAFPRPSATDSAGWTELAVCTAIVV